MIWLIAQEERLVNFLKRELAPSRERWHNTLRMLAASLLALSVAQIFRMNQGYWAVTTILVVCTSSMDSSVRRMLVRLAGTFAGVVCAYILSAVFWQQYWFFLAGLFAVLMYAGIQIARSLQPQVGWVFALTLMVCVEQSSPDFTSIAAVSFERMFVVALGVICSWLAVMLIYPSHPENDCAKMLRKALDDEIARANWVVLQLQTLDKVAESNPPPAVEPLEIKKMLTIVDRTENTSHDLYSKRTALADRISIVASISNILNDAIALAKLNNHQHATPLLMKSTPQLIIAIGSILHDLRSWTERDKNFLEYLANHSLDLSALKNALDAFSIAHEQVIQSLGIREGTGQSNRGSEAVLGIASICRAFYTTYSIEHGAHRKSRSPGNILNSLSLPLLAPGASDDNSRTYWFAIKLAISCVFGLFFVKAIQMPSLGAMMITPIMIVFATGGSTTGARSRARLRILGGALGGVVAIFAIIFLIPTARELHALLIIWIICASPLFWIANGGPKFAYVGVQATFAMAMAIGSLFAPTIDLAVPSARIIGIIFGSISTLVVFSYLAPDYARNELLRLYSLILRRIASLTTSGLPGNPSTFSQAIELRYRVLALMLRARVLADNLVGEPQATEPTITRVQSTEITDHLTLILSTAHAMALNRISAQLIENAMSDDFKEQFACAHAIERACDIGCAAIASGDFQEFARATAQLMDQTEALGALIPEIRKRPNIRRISADPAQFIVGQIGMYRVTAQRLSDLSDVFTRIAVDRNKFRSTKRPQIMAAQLAQQPA